MKEWIFHDSEVKHIYMEGNDSQIPLVNLFENLHLSEQNSESLEKVKEMNVKLENLRRIYLENSNATGLLVDLPQPKKILYEGNPQYYEFVRNFTCVTTLTLTWNKTEKGYFSQLNMVSNFQSNAFNHDYGWLLNKNYYRFTGSQLLCEWIIKGDINYRYGYMYNYTCNSDIKMASIPIPIEPLFFNSRSPTVHDVGPSPPPHHFEMPKVYHAMQIFTKSVVSSLGEPFCGEIQVKPHDCLNGPSSPPNATTISTFPSYREVFVISQRWGWGYFHRMIENIPRMALFLEFLRKYTTIKILAHDNSQKLLEILETLGLSRDRVITGWIRADIAYVPRATSCGTPNTLEMQYFQHYNYQFIKRNLLVQNDIKRNNLILIKRSGRRHFINHTLIEQLLNKTSKEFGFKFVVFGDNPPPALNETMILFSLASIVVAPHGAGLSNLVFGRSGTLVIEGLCNRPYTNLCYQRTAYALGMRWHGIPSLSGCEGMVDVDGEEIDFVLRSYIRVISADELKS